MAMCCTCMYVCLQRIILFRLYATGVRARVCVCVAYIKLFLHTNERNNALRLQYNRIVYQRENISNAGTLKLKLNLKLTIFFHYHFLNKLPRGKSSVIIITFLFSKFLLFLAKKNNARSIRKLESACSTLLCNSQDFQFRRGIETNFYSALRKPCRATWRRASTLSRTPYSAMRVIAQICRESALS